MFIIKTSHRALNHQHESNFSVLFGRETMPKMGTLHLEKQHETVITRCKALLNTLLHLYCIEK